MFNIWSLYHKSWWEFFHIFNPWNHHHSVKLKKTGTHVGLLVISSGTSFISVVYFAYREF